MTKLIIYLTLVNTMLDARHVGDELTTSLSEAVQLIKNQLILFKPLYYIKP